MRNKLIGGLVVAAALCMAAPAWADGGRGHGYGHGKHWHKHQFHGHHDRERYVHRQYIRERYVVREIVQPVPLYSQSNYPAAAGIHVIFPNVFVPFN